MLLAILICPLILSRPALPAQTVTAAAVSAEPVIDGSADDAVWSKAKEYTILDQRSKAKITLKAIYTQEAVSFLVSYPDDTENVQHKPFAWDKKTGAYKIGPQREDSFTFKWSMEEQNIDLSNYSNDIYSADVWYWKAARTNPAGYSDDKMHRLAKTAGKKAKELTTKNGKKRYLMRIGDQGKSASKKQLIVDYQGDIQDQYLSQAPSGSRADVKAKGVWKEGVWTIEFSRKLNTGHTDDIQFQPGTGTNYQFGVSIFGLYGNPIDDAKDHYYGQGRISEALFLAFQ